MAINFTNFLNAPSAESPWKNALESVLKGYQMAEEPAKMKQQSEQRDLVNQLKKLEVEHKPTEYQLTDQGKKLANALHSKALETYDEKWALEKDLKKAQIQKALQTNIGGSVKANGELANYMVSHPDATQEDIRKAYEEIHGSKLAHEQAVTERSKDITTGNSFDKLPANDKKQSVALMKGMGADPVAAVSWLRSGKTPTDYADEKRIDISTVEPDYALGEQNIKIAQQADANIKELDNLEGHITKGLGNYRDKIKGYSFEQISDALKGENSDKQAHALAARALLPELSSLRLKIMGGNIGIEALREMEHKSLGQLNIIEGLVDENTYQKTQDLIKDWINEAGRVRIKSLNKFSMLKTKLQKSAANESKGGKVLNLATGQWEDE